MLKSLWGIFFILCYGSVFSQAFKIDPFIEDSSFKATPIKVITEIKLIGNKITKPTIILRELTFDNGDTLSNEALVDALEQSKKNILNTSLFNFARLDVAILEGEKVTIFIQLTERWYLFPLPIFEIDDNNFNTWWKDKDFSRINYGFYLKRDNFRGRKEKLSITARYGFSEQYRLKYSIPYIDKKQKSGLSFSFSYNRKDEIAYTSFDNERLQYKNQDNDALRNYSAGITYLYRRKIFSTHAFGLEYDYNSITDSVRILNSNYLGDSLKKTHFFSFYYTFVKDRRDSKNYPLKGHFIKAGFQKYGLGILDSPVDLFNISLEAKKYIELSSRFFFAGSLRGIWTENEKQPYLLRNGLGYSSFGIRSYEYYVIDGQSIALAKAQVKFQLVKPRSANLGFITERFGKFHYAFYLGLFTDAAYVEDNVSYPNNRLANEIQFGSGIALDFVSYYDIVIRTEFSVNKFGESGLFLHFVAPI
jgi:outer membrane protein assembly factor BamA